MRSVLCFIGLNVPAAAAPCPTSLDTDRLRPYDPGIGAPEGREAPVPLGLKPGLLGVNIGDEDRRLRSHTPAGLCGPAGVDHVRPGRQRADTRVPALDPRGPGADRSRRPLRTMDRFGDYRQVLTLAVPPLEE